MRKDLEHLWTLAEPYVRDAGFDLIEVQYGREQRGLVLRLFIDRPVPDRIDRPVPDRIDRPQGTAIGLGEIARHDLGGRGGKGRRFGDEPNAHQRRRLRARQSGRFGGAGCRRQDSKYVPA